MSRDWTQEELEIVSSAMKKAGHISYEEFCKAIRDGSILITSASACESEQNNDIRHYDI